jgi:hypothetical protein
MHRTQNDTPPLIPELPPSLGRPLSSEFVLSDPTLPPSLSLPPKITAAATPKQRRNARRATSTWVGHSADVSTMLHRNAQINDDGGDGDDDHKNAMGSNHGVVAFEALHRQFALQLTKRIFDGQLKSFQRALLPITPQSIGLAESTQIRQSSEFSNFIFVFVL